MSDISSIASSLYSALAGYYAKAHGSEAMQAAMDSTDAAESGETEVESVVSASLSHTQQVVDQLGTMLGVSKNENSAALEGLYEAVRMQSNADAIIGALRAFYASSTQETAETASIEATEDAAVETTAETAETETDTDTESGSNIDVTV
ncbi:hypothetical protein JXA32_08260 [Candidatus Sumerlaeota bacterium]|nr:hypothetical protein [Candidatus Sumerlaeota bacterium]